jgi:hypothetical protein
MNNGRSLPWEGFVNARDLGGLRTADNRMTRWGAVVRSDDPARLTAAGWSALYAHGVRTILSLRTRGLEEKAVDVSLCPGQITTLTAEIEDAMDPGFGQWINNELWSTPLYYMDALERWPQRHAEALLSIARARPGGVLFHCRRGVDRTGIIALLLLSAVGVTPDEILADYEMSIDPERDVLLAREHTTTKEVIRAVLEGLNINAYLREGGMSTDDLDVLRERLLEPL